MEKASIGEKGRSYGLLDDAVEGSGLPFGIYENGGQLMGSFFQGGGEANGGVTLPDRLAGDSFAIDH